METLVKRIKYKSKKDIYHLIPLGDMHYGNLGCDKKRVVDICKWIEKTPNAVWIGIGDYADCS